MNGFSLGQVIEIVAAIDPAAPAQVQVGSGTRRLFTWGDFSRRTAGVADALVERGLTRQGKVAQYLFNCPEYLESAVACYRAAFVPVNTNYRYVESELLYLWDNADVEAVVFHGCFSERIEGMRDRLGGIKTWLWVDDGSGECPTWAEDYESLAESSDGALDLPWERSGDDLWILYTGGTTGMPKGVMWRQGDLFAIANHGRPAPYDLTRGLSGLGEQMEEVLSSASDFSTQPPTVIRPVQMPACPLMHGTGYLTAQGALLGGGCVVTHHNRHFDPEALLDVICDEGVQSAAIVGDAFARPILQALDSQPQRWNLERLVSMVSSGVMWSEEVKQGLLRHHPQLILSDALGSSESIGMARTDSTAGTGGATANFTLGDFACVIDDDGRKVEPGSGVVGRIAVSGWIPVGYYKDEEKTAATFPVIDGVRYSVAGDHATLAEDGSLQLLGRGSVCINTGGEKVFPEEVEEALKQHEAVRDAIVVGIPDERFGQAITAVVELHPEGEASDQELSEWVKGRLAAYKAPRRVLFRDSLGRAPNGKADYNGTREWAVESLGLASAS